MPFRMAYYLAEEDWQRRHRLMLWMLGAARPGAGRPRSRARLHAAHGDTGRDRPAGARGARVTCCATTGGWPSMTVTAGLVYCSAALVVLTHGTIEAHFHFFVIIGFIALYQDWAPFLFNIVFTVISHGIGSAWQQTLIFDHVAGQDEPVAVVVDPRRRRAGRLRRERSLVLAGHRGRAAGEGRAGAAGSPIPRSTGGSSRPTCSPTSPAATRASCTGSWRSSTSSRSPSATPTRSPTSSRSTTSPPACGATPRTCSCSPASSPRAPGVSPCRCATSCARPSRRPRTSSASCSSSTSRAPSSGTPSPTSPTCWPSSPRTPCASRRRTPPSRCARGPTGPVPAAGSITIEDWGVGMPAEQIERGQRSCSRRRRTSTCRCRSGWASTWSPGSRRATASRWR